MFIVLFFIWVEYFKGARYVRSFKLVTQPKKQLTN